jgi:hypothetical protein
MSKFHFELYALLRTVYAYKRLTVRVSLGARNCERRMQLAYERWTQGREVPTLGTNAGAEVLPFQTWRHFKEAFAPELVARAIKESERTVRRCADPFGGSGTTALTCQFLGVDPVIVEVNPYLADLIEAKLAQYDGAALTRDFGQVLRRSIRGRVQSISTTCLLRSSNRD